MPEMISRDESVPPTVAPVISDADTTREADGLGPNTDVTDAAVTQAALTHAAVADIGAPDIGGRDTRQARPSVVGVDAVGRYLALLRTDFIAVCLATVSLAGVAIGYRAWALLILCVTGFTSMCIRQLGRIYAPRGEMTKALSLYAGAYWIFCIVACWIVPIGLPVFLFNALAPVLLAATYLPDRDHKPIALAAVPVVGIMGALGLAQDGARVEDLGPDYAVNITVVSFLVGHMWMFTAAVRDANRTRVDTLAAALDANDDLAASEAELRRSRRRVVEIADAERGRIERDLHDGAQQRLVSLAVQLKLASQLTDDEASTAQLETLHGEATGALEEIRQLASGIYPSLLAERGLVDALRAACRRVPVAVSFESELVGDVPDHLAPDLYFVVSEALQNAAKHGGPDTSIEVCLSGGNEEIVVTVDDDGPGFVPDAGRLRGGLLNMQDRIASLEGELTIASSPGTGTTVRACVPLRR